MATTSTGSRRARLKAAGGSSFARHSTAPPTDVTPPPINVRTRVHEYGGGSYTVADGVVVFSEFSDGRLYRLDPGSDAPVAITPEGPMRYADLRADVGRAPRPRRPRGPRRARAARRIDRRRPARRRQSAGRPRHRAPISWPRPARRRTGRCSPGSSGTTRTCRGMPRGCGSLPSRPTARSANRELAAGGPDESIVQPEWSPAGVLHFASDRTGWWNLYRLIDGPSLEALAPMDAEFADPAWVFGRSSYGFTADGSIVADCAQGRPRPPVPHPAGTARSARSNRRSPSSKASSSARARSSPSPAPPRSRPWSPVSTP